MDKVTIVIKYEKDYAEYRYILTKIDEIAETVSYTHLTLPTKRIV